MKNSFICLLLLLLVVSAIPFQKVSAENNTLIEKHSVKKLIIEDFLDTSKPLKTSDGEFVDTAEYFNEDKDQMNPFVIIGSDGRTKVTDSYVMPYRAMALLLIEFQNYNYLCTGTIIDDFKILTNAHCLQDEDTGERAIEVVALPGVHDSHYGMGAYWSESTHVPALYYNNGQPNLEFDFGVVVMDKKGQKPGKVAGQLPIQQVTNLSNNQLLKTYGYPGDKSPTNLWGMEGNLVVQTDRLALYNMDTVSGQSGSAVLNANNQIVAVHRGSYTYGTDTLNGGPKMTATVVNFINNAN